MGKGVSKTVGIKKVAPKTKQLSAEERITIKLLSDRGYSILSIAKKLGRAYSTVHAWTKRYEEFGHVDRLPGSGRPKKFSERDARAMCRMIQSNRETTIEDIQKYFDWKPANAKTVSKIIHENLNVLPGWKTRKPFVCEMNRKK